MRRRIPEMPRLPVPQSKRIPARERRKRAEDIFQKYRRRVPRSRMLGLSDATGSMTGLWDATRQQIQEMIRRIVEMGVFELQWVAYRDYTDGSHVLEPSGWQHSAEPLLEFLRGVRCFGGGDRPEAVERGLAFAASEDEVTRVLLIGDAPPHEDRDYRTQATALGRKTRPVHCFVVGNAKDTFAAFSEIARLSGGTAAHLRSHADLVDVVAMTAAADLQGAKGVREYVERYKAVNASAREYARLLLSDGRGTK